MTDTEDDPFDLERLTLSAEMVRQHRATVPRKIQRRRHHFIRFPWTWADKLTKARHISTYRVALHLLYQHWKTGGGPIQLANGSLATEGVERRQKWRALRELEQLGLIAVKRRPRKSPQITVIV
jgi:hypothetical protein